MAYKGDYPSGATVYGYFSTHAAAGGNVAPLSAFEAADVVVYENGNNVQITAGITVTSPFDAEVGFHHYAIDLSNAAYTVGNDYTVVLAPDDETVDGQTITAIPLDEFSYENRYMRGTDSAATAAALTAVDDEIAVIDGIVDQILIDTAEIGAAGAGLTALATQASVNTIDGIVDQILVDTNELQTDNVPGLIAALNNISTADIDTALATYDAPTRAELTADKTEVLEALGVLAVGTAQSGGTSTIQLASATSFADDVLNRTMVHIIAGTGLGQSRLITDWVSATDTATVNKAWTINPDATSRYVVAAVKVSDAGFINSARVLGDGNASAWDGE